MGSRPTPLKFRSFNSLYWEYFCMQKNADPRKKNCPMIKELVYTPPSPWEICFLDLPLNTDRHTVMGFIYTFLVKY